MLKRWRLSQVGVRVVAAFLATLMVAGSLDAYHLAKDDDPDFGLAVAFHGHLNIQLSASPHKAGASDPHCAICHWLQSLGTSRIATRPQAIPPASHLQHPSTSHVHGRVLACDQVPARGPPAA